MRHSDFAIPLLGSEAFKNENLLFQRLSDNNILILQSQTALEMKSSINAVIAVATILNHQHVAASAAMTPDPDSLNHLSAMSMEATSMQSAKSGKTIRSRSSKTGKASKVSTRSKDDGLEDESKPQQEDKVTFYVE